MVLFSNHHLNILFLLTLTDIHTKLLTLQLILKVYAYTLPPRINGIIHYPSLII